MLDLLLSDGRTPTGGFAHSGGVEAARVPLGDVPAFLRGRLQTVGLIDAATAVAASRGQDPLALDVAWAARTPAPPLRDAARRQGRSLIRLANAVFPGALDAYAAASSLTPRPVVLGLLARPAGLDAMRVAQLCLYDDAATCCAAVPKLYAIDALDVTGWLVALAPLIEQLAERAGDGDLPAPATPLLDLRALSHLDDSRRLFVT